MRHFLNKGEIAIQKAYYKNLLTEQPLYEKFIR